MNETRKGLDAKRRWVADERLEETSDSVDESSEKRFGSKLEEDTGEISRYDEESPQAAASNIRKSYHGSRSFEAAGDSHLSPGVECESKYIELPPKRSECSNFTEPSFQYGSFLPPLRDSGLERVDPNLRYSEVTNPGGVNNEDLWEGLWADHNS